MVCVLLALFFVFLYHISTAQDRRFYLDFFPCFPTYTDFPSCFLRFRNRIRLPHSSSAQWEHRDKSRLPWALQAHFYTSSFLFPLWHDFPSSCVHVLGHGCSRASALEPVAARPHLFRVPAARSEGKQVQGPCFCRCCCRLNGFHCTWKVTDFAVITSLLAQQTRRLRYLSGYWVSAERVLCPLLRGQRI